MFVTVQMASMSLVVQVKAGKMNKGSLIQSTDSKS